MQCEEFEDRLNRLLDHRLSPDDDASLANHSHECEECAALFHAQHRLFTGLKSRIQPPVDLATRVVSQRHLEVSQRRANWRNAGWAVLLASAASLGGLALMALRNDNAQSNVVKKDPVPGTQSGTGLAITGIGAAQNQAAAPDKPDEKLGEYFVALENFASQISDSKEFDGVSESLEPGIKPIRSSFGLALDALRRTLPRGKETRATKPDAGASWLPDLPVIS